VLEREIRNAGFGVTGLINIGCPNLRMWNNSTSAGRTIDIHPIEIVNTGAAGLPAADANTDVLMVIYGASDSFVDGVLADQAADATSDFYITANIGSFRSGDVVVGVQNNAGTLQCTAHELTRVPYGSGNCSQTAPAAGVNYLEHRVTTGYKGMQRSCTDGASILNKTGGVTTAAGASVVRLSSANNGRLFNLGYGAQIKLFAVRGGNLTQCEWLSQDCTAVANWAVIADNIVSLRALYGTDTNADGTIDSWSRTTPVSTAQIMGTFGVALQLVARSALKEKPATTAGTDYSGTNCDATLDKNFPDRGQTAQWYESYNATLTAAAVDLSGLTDWRCYRYKQFQTTVALRNLIWRP
jgi:type IV pilus assembly protein PilW